MIKTVRADSSLSELSYLTFLHNDYRQHSSTVVLTWWPGFITVDELVKTIHGDSASASQRKEIEDTVKGFDFSADGKLSYRGTYSLFAPFSRTLTTGNFSSSFCLLLRWE